MKPTDIFHHSVKLFTITLLLTTVAHSATRRSFDEYPPAFGFQLSTAFNAFGKVPFRPQQVSTTRAFSLSIEYQPKMIQKYGIIGFGPTLSVYPIFKDTVTSHFASLYSFGIIGRYQLHYFKRQMIVPMVAYSYEHFGYAFTDSTSPGSFSVKGPTFGLWIYLNFLDIGSATQFYVNQGVMRSYLILEVKTLTGSDAQISVGGRSYFAGLRFEF